MPLLQERYLPIIRAFGWAARSVVSSTGLLAIRLNQRKKERKRERKKVRKKVRKKDGMRQ